MKTHVVVVVVVLVLVVVLVVVVVVVVVVVAVDVVVVVVLHKERHAEYALKCERRRRTLLTYRLANMAAHASNR